MKTKHYLLGAATVALALFITSCLKENVNPIQDASVNDTKSMVTATPCILDTDWKSGNAMFENNRIGNPGTFAYKINYWLSTGMNGTYIDPFGQPGTASANPFTITNSTTTSFSWTSPRKVKAIIVKGGTHANVFCFENGACEGEGMISPLNPKNKNGLRFGISHVTVIWDDEFCTTNTPVCYGAKGSATVVGTTFTNGNWFMYTSHPESGSVSKTVNIQAGSNPADIAGTATITEVPGESNVLITVNLVGYAFYYASDEGNTVISNENFKVALIPNSNIPTQAPSWGNNPYVKYKYTANIQSNTHTITVAKADNYFIHLDIFKEVTCP